MKIRNQLLLTFIPLVVLPVVTIIGLFSWIFTGNLLDQEGDVLRARNRLLVREIESQYASLQALGIHEVPFYRDRMIEALDSQLGESSVPGADYLIVGQDGQILGPKVFQDRRLSPEHLTRLFGTRRFTQWDGLPWDPDLGAMLAYWDQVEHPPWRVVSLQSRVRVLQPIRDGMVYTGLIGLGAVGLAIIGVLVAARRVSLPLMELTATVGRFDGTQLETDSTIGYPGEVGVLAREFNRMAQRLTTFTQDLEGLVQSKTEDLEVTQGQLVQAEKMASLGRLVAGFSHEVNTPLGIAVTANTHADELLREIRALVLSPEVSKTRLLALLDRAGESCGLTTQNLERSNALIQTFKQVAVDYHVEKPRVIEVEEFLQEITPSLRALIPSDLVTIQISCPGELNLRTYPGVLWQVLSNLTQNAAIHAFDGQEEGSIGIAVSGAGPAGVEIRFLDNGIGIPPELRDQVFEPFFTTKRSQGSTGLGLHIVYNLITQKLGGSIRIESPENQGTCFVIGIPSLA